MRLLIHSADTGCMSDGAFYSSPPLPWNVVYEEPVGTGLCSLSHL